MIATHPDDETLGCGGTLLKHRDNGDEIYWMIITGVSEKMGYSQKFITARKQEIEEIAEEYKMNDVYKLDFPAAQLDKVSLGDIISKIGQVFEQIKPQIIYLPNRSDIHSDHRITFETVMSCTKSFRYPFIKRILMYETISETEFSPPLEGKAFQPNSFCDISDYMEAKLKILDIYKSELGEHPFPRSKRNVKALATYRGATAGVEYAESFMILKDIF